MTATRKLQWPLVVLLVVVVFFANALLFDKLINAPRVYQYTLIAPSDDELFVEIDKWGVKGWEIIYMRRATGETATGDREPLYEITMKREIVRGPFDSRHIPGIYE